MSTKVSFEFSSSGNNDYTLWYDIGGPPRSIFINANGKGGKTFNDGEVVDIIARAFGTPHDTVTVKIIGAKLVDDVNKKDKSKFTFKTRADSRGGDIRTIEVES